MPIEYDYITSFIQRMENSPPTFAPIRKGYVPMKNGVALGNSGVTIGTGVDLGQQTANGLSHMGVPTSIIGILTPYLGQKKQDAIKKLTALPLVLSPDATFALDRAVIGSYIRATATRFDYIAQKSSPSTSYRLQDRPKQVQAVATSVEYQLGAKGAYTFIHALAQGNYAQTVTLLKQSKYYTRRRNAEASLLQEIVHA